MRYKRINHRGLSFIFDKDNSAFYLSPEKSGSLTDFRLEREKIKLPEESSKHQKDKKLIAVLNLENYSGCNLSCSYCFAAKKHLHPHKMPFKTAKKAIDFFVDYFKKQAVPMGELYLDFTGTGEPLLNIGLIKNMAEYILKHKRRKRIYLRFTSNGTLFDQKIIKILKDYYKKSHRLLRFSLSFDGPAQLNDSIRHYSGGKGTADIVLKAMRDLERENILKLADNVNSTFTFDRPFLAHRLIYLYYIGCKEIIMKPYRGLDKRFCLTKQRLGNVKKEYSILINLLLTKILSEKDFGCLYSILNPGDLLGRFLLRVFMHSKQERRCLAGYLSFFVDQKGEIFLCPSFGSVNKSYLGNINNGFDAFSLEKARENKGLFDDCQKCWAEKLCGGQCMYDTYIRRSTKPDKLLCELKKYLIKESAYFFAVLQLKAPKTVKTIENHLKQKQHIYFD